MTLYLLRRVIELLPVLFLASIVVFLLLHLAPGDPSYFVAGRDATPEELAAVRKKLGLDKPLHVQYLIWLAEILQGNLGESALSGQPVSKLIQARLPATLHLTVAGFLVTILLSLLAGVPGALRPNSKLDHFCSAYSAAAFGIPVFWLGILFILLFSVRLRWLPPSGYLSILEDPLRSMRFLLMPALTLGIANSGVLSRFIKFSVLETLRQDYIRTARAKGLAERVVIRRHALRNALIPVVTVAALMVGRLLGGAVVIEVVFAWPGLGRLLLDGVNNRDYPVVQATLLFVVLVFVLVNLVTDFLYVYLDPRVQLERK
ncbi:MAG: ABC transporter permease [Chloroflexi bacterium]|nr:ABC transporter permease [Chloroflexota bacterium]